ncbi:MAG: hypothetical protein U0325_00845 [Polyangiales bacterium]
MEPFTDVPLGRASLAASTLLAQHPPRPRHANKRAVFELSAPPGAVHAGVVTVSRWPQRAAPRDLAWWTSPTAVVLREDVFTYEPPPPGRVAWHLNFAHTILFVAYAGPLFAQDEMQVAEHPALASVREWLTAAPRPGLRPVTREDGAATPVLVQGVERRCAIATDPDLDADRPAGLYGNAFARARVTAVQRATRVLSPPTITNVLAMEAPPGGVGRYTAAQIEDVFATAYTGFRAARAASGEGCEVEVRTGHWGTGAYGGDRVLMALLQLLAARAAGIARVVFHTVNAEGAAPVREALRRLDALAGHGAVVGDALTRIEAEGFTWGVSDGN